MIAHVDAPPIWAVVAMLALAMSLPGPTPTAVSEVTPLDTNPQLQQPGHPPPTSLDRELDRALDEVIAASSDRERRAAKRRVDVIRAHRELMAWRFVRNYRCRRLLRPNPCAVDPKLRGCG